MNLGILTLLPPLIILIVAVKSRSTTSSLLIGVVVCSILQYKTGFLAGFIDLMYAVAGDDGTAWYVMFVALFGCILGIWSRTGATQALAQQLQKYATTQKRTLLLTWLMGVLVFIDDFTGIAVRGTMTKLYDNNKIPRAMLSYMTDATASPLNALIPIGTWGIFYQSVFAGYPEVMAYGSSMSVFSKTVPFLFYGWIAIIIALLVALGVIKPIGAMKEAYKRAKETGKLYSKESEILNAVEDDDEVFDKSKLIKLLIGFFMPLITFIAVVLINGDVITASLITLVIMILLFIVLGLEKWNNLMVMCMDGVGDVLPMIVIVFAAYMVRDSLIAIGLPEYVVSVAEPFMSPVVLPVLTFIICAFLAFISGTNWGSGLPVAAIVIPLCAALGGNMFLVLAAVMSGAAFGAHACFYCDVTIFTSGMTKIDNMEHAVAQLPLCLIGGVITTALYLVAGFVF